MMLGVMLLTQFGMCGLNVFEGSHAGTGGTHDAMRVVFFTGSWGSLVLFADPIANSPRKQADGAPPPPPPT